MWFLRPSQWLLRLRTTAPAVCPVSTISQVVSKKTPITVQQSLAEDALPDILQEESTGDRLFPDLFDDRVSPSGMGHEVERFAQFEIMEWNRFNPRANSRGIEAGASGAAGSSFPATFTGAHLTYGLTIA